MMTSWNGNLFRVRGHLCGELTGHRWIPRTKASDAELWRFFGILLNKRLSKTMVSLVIWDTIAPIMTSLSCVCHWWKLASLQLDRTGLIISRYAKLCLPLNSILIKNIVDAITHGIWLHISCWFLILYSMMMIVHDNNRLTITIRNLRGPLEFLHKS